MGLFDRLKGRTQKRRAIMIGLDGTPCSLVQRFAEDGTMPNLRNLLPTGTLKRMTTTIPEISSVAWSSFMTGR